MNKNRIKIGIILFLLIAIIITLILNYNDKSKIIAEVESDFGPIWVFEENNLRCMSFLKPPTPITQSCMNLSNHKIIVHNYAKLFTSAIFFVENPRKILVIGLGGASIHKALNAIFPNAHIDSVEINTAIPAIVEKYFDYKENQLNKIFIEDGAKFVKNGVDQTYDIIFIDAFSKNYIPPQMLTDEFMQNIKRLLTDNGVVAINTFKDTEYSDLEADLFKRNFDNYYNLIAGGSKVMLAGKKLLPPINEISASANLWRFRFVEIGVDQYGLLQLIQGNSSN